MVGKVGWQSWVGLGDHRFLMASDQTQDTGTQGFTCHLDIGAMLIQISNPRYTTSAST